MLYFVPILALHIGGDMPDQVIEWGKSFTMENEAGRSHLHVRCEHCGPWIDHWAYHAKENAGLCGVLGCNSKAELGAHVRLTKAIDSIRPYVYIIPMCATHNQAKGEIKSKPRIKLVYAEQQACGEIRSQKDA